MKRVKTRIVVCLLAAAFLFSGCNKTEGNTVKLDPENPVTLEVWHYYNGSLKTAFDDMVTEFNETVGLEQGIIVDAFSQGSVESLIEKILDSAAGKVGAEKAPDIFAAYADTAFQVDQLGLVADISPYFTEEELSEYVPGYIEEGRLSSDGALKIFPMAKSTEVLMLNGTYWEDFAATTGAEQSELSTIEGITRLSKKYYEWTDSLTEEPDDGKAFFGRDAVANYFIVGSQQLGTELFKVSSNSVKIQADKENMRKLWDNFYLPYVNGWFGAYRRFRTDDIKMGDLIACVGSTSGVNYFPSQITINDTEDHPISMMVLPPPCFEDGEKVAVQQGAGMVVKKSDSQTEYAACVFLKWFTETDRNLNFTLESGYLPVKKDANSMEKVEEMLSGENAVEIKEQTKMTLPVAFETVQNYQLYTNKAFNGGTEARSILEKSMFTLAQEDAEKVDAMVAKGQSRAEAAAQFTTDTHFEEWYEGFIAALNEAIQ